MPDVAINWFVGFFCECKQFLNVGGKLSLPQSINSGIVQGPGVWPMCYVGLGSDLRTLSLRINLCKYADDTNLLMPAYSDIGLNTEFDIIEPWADINQLYINLDKTKEIVCHRTCVIVQNVLFIPPLFVELYGLMWLSFLVFLFGIMSTTAHMLTLF